MKAQVSLINKQSLTLSQLTQTIKLWITNLTPRKLPCEFKYSIQSLKSIPKQFITKAILYTCLKQLKDFINASSQQKHQKVMNIVISIKQFYYVNSIEGIWKDNFNFQFSLIYLTKIATGFCSEHFKQVHIDFKFQSEIFIVFVHVMLGTNMGVKSYKLLQKKYTGKKNLKLISLTKKKKILSTKDLLKTEEFREEDYDKDNRLSKDSVQDFRKDLRISLYVQPLPKLEIKKKSLNYFLKPTNLEEKYSIRSKINSIEQRLKKKVVKSTELSASLKTEIKKHQSLVTMHNKPFKINHRLPLFNLQKCAFNHKMKKTEERETPINKQLENEKEKTKFESKEWRSIIGNMKDVIHEDQQKIEFRIMRSFQDRKTNVQQTMIQKGSQKKEDLTEKNIVSQKNFRMQQKITAAPQINRQSLSQKKRKMSNKTPPPQEKNYKFMLPSSKELKAMKRQFEKNCGIRDHKIQHSIFLLPSLKTSTQYSSQFKV